ncbi:MAG: mechanosensitive ion channel [Pseudomonadales bacterium]|nr:mechanosensitive ion channel [Pseudomonadales bacterium]
MEAIPEELSTDSIQGYIDQFVEVVITEGPQIVLAIVVLLVGLWIIKRVVNLVNAGLERGETDETLSKFLSSLASIVLKALLFITVAGMIGIETTSFIAILGAAGLAIGLALQGTLANFAGGVLILLFRPYKIGDFVEAQGVAGTVAGIQIFNTVIRTGDNKRIIVPNGAISNGIITNFSAEEKRRVDMVFGIGYDDDVTKAKETLKRILSEDDRIHADPEPFVVVSELADSSVNFTVRVWVDAANYWGVFFGTTEKVKIVFDQEGISIPYPQQDIHVHQSN